MKPKAATVTSLLAVAAVTALVYLPSLRGEFVEWDDSGYVVNNFHIRALNVAFLRWAFTAFHESNWHPLTWVSHALDYAAWGLHPAGHHLTNVVLHVVNTMLVGLLASALAQARGGFNNRRTAVAGTVTAALFGLHPAHVESVAWVAERKDVLCGLFYLSSVLAHAAFAVRSPEPGKRAIREAPVPYALSLACCVLALLCKPMAVSLPAVLLILDAFPYRRVRSWNTAAAAIAEKLPCLAAVAASSILTLFAARAGGAMTWAENLPLSTRLIVAADSLVVYLGKLLLPVRLVPVYPYPADVSLTSPQHLLAAVAVVAITVVALRTARTRPWYGAAWAAYVVMLLPVLGIVQVGSQAMADRYTYLPSIPVFMIIAFAASGASRFAKPLAVAGLASAAVLSALTVRQIGVWRTSFTLWGEVLRHEPERVPFGWNNLGLAYLAADDLEQAIRSYTRAIELSPTYWAAYFNRGVAFLERGDADRALADFESGLALNPLAKIYYLRGMAFERKGDLEAARADYERSIELEPEFVDPYVGLGVLHGRAGSFDDAMELFDRAIAIDPNHPLAYANRGFAYGLRGDTDEAIRDLSWALKLDPSDAKVRFNRGGVYLRAGDRARAAADFRRACEQGEQRGCDAALQIGGGNPS